MKSVFSNYSLWVRWLFIALTCVLSGFTAPIFAQTVDAISGTILLPGGAPATQEIGVTIELYETQDMGGGYVDRSWHTNTSVTIPIGASESSTDYSFLVSPGAGVDGWAIRYRCGYGCDGYVGSGWFSDSGSVFEFTSATYLPIGNDYPDKDLTLLPGVAITGTVSLPAGDTALTDYNINIYANNQNGSGSVSTNVTLNASSPTPTYTLMVPQDSAASWQVRYNCWGCDPYITTGYYDNTNGTTIWDSNAAASIPGNAIPNPVDLTLVKGKTIDGTVRLPGGDMAATEIELTVQLYETYDSGGGSLGYMEVNSTSVTIPVGASESSTDYSFLVSPGAGDEGWAIRYSCNYGCDGYVGSGWFSESGTTFDFNSATYLPIGNDHLGKDLTLLPGSAITGTLSLPGGDTAATSTNFQINARNQNGSTVSTSVTLSTSNPTPAYSLLVPQDSSASWDVYYQCSGNCDPYVSYGYYDYTSSNTIWNSSAATPIPGDPIPNPVNLTLVTGNTISGTVYLPEAHTSDLWVDVHVEDISYYNYMHSQSVYIAAGQISGEYSIAVVPDTSVNWQVSYNCYGCDPYFERGYYADSGTTWDSNQASLIPGDNIPNPVNLTLVVAYEISGTVSRPAGAAMDESISVGISASNTVGSGWANQYVTIPTGSEDISYSLSVVPDNSAQWQVSYNCHGCDPYLVSGYYTDSGTSWDSNQASVIPGDNIPDPVNLTLIEGYEISGTVFRPAGAATDEAIDLQIDASNTAGSGGAGQNVTIPAGSQEISYSLFVAPDDSAQWQVSYDCSQWSTPDGCAGYVNEGYYVDNSTTSWDSNQASLIPGDNIPDPVNLILVVGNKISGTVSRPAGAATAEAIDLRVSASNAAGSGEVDQTVTIPIGSNEVSYSLTVAPDISAQWQVSYACQRRDTPEGCAAYAEYGYYINNSITTWDSDQATLIPGNAIPTSVDLTLVEGFVLSGMVSRPVGAATDEVIEVEISASNTAGSGWADQTVTIPANSDEISYSLYVLPDPAAQWRVSYDCGQWSTPDGCSGYVDAGYYLDNSTTTWDFAQATSIAGSAIPASVDLTLIAGNTVSGTITLPNGETAPSGGLAIEVIAEDSPNYVNGFSRYFSIEPNQTSVTYSITIPMDQNIDWRFHYYCDDDFAYGCTEYVNRGYYAGSETIWDPSQATLVSGGSIPPSVDLTLLEGSNVSGRVSLPAGYTAPIGDGVGVRVYFQDSAGFSNYFGYAYIRGNESSTTYNMRIPSDTGVNWRVSYECYGCSEYLGTGYYDYSTGETVWDASAATLTPGDSIPASVDITLVLDTDQDQVPDDIDNCPDVANPNQLDTDGDMLGNVCDSDDDADGFPDDMDLCPLVANEDSDGDGIADACEDDGFCFPVKTSSGAVALICL